MSFVSFGVAPWHATVVNIPAARRVMRPQGLVSWSRQALDDDEIGFATLILTGLVIGSAVQIETQAGAVIENRTADATSETFSVPTFEAGNAANNLRIKVRKGSSSPFYLPYETLAIASVGAQSVFVSQIPDE